MKSAALQGRCTLTPLIGSLWHLLTPICSPFYSVKIVTHDRYSFYNPKQHPVFTQQGGRVIYFDGTYSNTFSGNPNQTPRYDYNLIMYRLDLNDPRLALPVAIYRAVDRCAFAARRAASAAEAVSATDRTRIAFFAFDRPGDRLVPVYAEDGKRGRLSLEANQQTQTRSIAFYALPSNSNSPPAATVPLYEYAADDGRLAYSVNSTTGVPGFRRNEKPLCRVWNNPFMPL